MTVVIYRFGPFDLDTRAGELRRNGERVPVTPKVFQLLLLLVQNAGRLIPKSEILDKVWDSTHVEEGSVTRTVTRLRSRGDNSGRLHTSPYSTSSVSVAKPGAIRC